MLQEDVHLCILHLTHIMNSALVIRLFNNANKSPQIKKITLKSKSVEPIYDGLTAEGESVEYIFQRPGG